MGLVHLLHFSHAFPSEVYLFVTEDLSIEYFVHQRPSQGKKFTAMWALGQHQ